MRHPLKNWLALIPVFLILAGNLSGAFHYKHQKEPVSGKNGTLEHFIGENEVFLEIEEKEVELYPSVFRENVLVFSHYEGHSSYLRSLNHVSKTPDFIRYRKLLI